MFKIEQEYRDALIADHGFENTDIDAIEEERNSNESVVHNMTKAQLTDAIEATEAVLEQTINDIRISEAITALEDNEDFKTFELAYFQTEKDRLVSVLTTGSHVDRDVRDDITEKLRAMGSLNAFLNYKSDSSMLKDNKLKEITLKIDLDDYEFELGRGTK